MKEGNESDLFQGLKDNILIKNSSNLHINGLKIFISSIVKCIHGEFHQFLEENGVGYLWYEDLCVQFKQNLICVIFRAPKKQWILPILRLSDSKLFTVNRIWNASHLHEASGGQIYHEFGWPIQLSSIWLQLISWGQQSEIEIASLSNIHTYIKALLDTGKSGRKILFDFRTVSLYDKPPMSFITT